MKKIMPFIILIPLVFTGCSRAKELESRSFVVSAGINNGDFKKYKLSLGLITPLKDNLFNSKETSVESNEPIIDEKSQIGNSKSFYLGHLKTAILGTDILKNGEIGEFLSCARSNPNINVKTIITSYDGDCDSLIKSMTQSENSLYLWDYYQNNVAFPENEKTDIERITREIDQFGSTVIPIVKQSDGKIYVSGAYIYKNALCGQLDENELKGLMFLKGYYDKCELSTEKGDFYIKSQKSKYGFYEKDGKIYVNVKIKIDAQANTADYKDCHDSILNVAQNDTKSCIEKLQKADADAAGILYRMKNENPKLYEKYLNINIFPNMIFDIDTEVKISGPNVIE
ncbi:MAG: Ger(x)C family spore germination C-terminal domain-containing protein [Clostridia bacterium]|jgi:hypothetical protein|nr:Ger(x)C family spore germination C-terminal domain-containing protein [Clostridia bacterium]